MDIGALDVDLPDPTPGFFVPMFSPWICITDLPWQDLLIQPTYLAPTSVVSILPPLGSPMTSTHKGTMPDDPGFRPHGDYELLINSGEHGSRRRAILMPRQSLTLGTPYRMEQQMKGYCP